MHRLTRNNIFWEYLGAFHYAGPSGQRPVELTKEKWNDSFHQNSISNQTEAFHLRFDQNFGYITMNCRWKREFLLVQLKEARADVALSITNTDWSSKFEKCLQGEISVYRYTGINTIPKYADKELLIKGEKDHVEK